MEFLIIKGVTVVLIVLALSIIAEKVSPKLTGILSGLPLGTTLILIFYYIEYGEEFASHAAIYNVHGLLALLAFIFGYYIATFYTKKFEILFCIFISFFFYGIIALILAFIPVNEIYTPIIVIFIITLSVVYFAKIPDSSKPINAKISFVDLIFRMIFTVVFFLTITTAPKYFSANVSGIIASFPNMMVPLLIIIHFKHSRFQARTILINTPLGLNSIVVYSTGVHYLYPKIGLLNGTVVSFVLCILYIVIQMKILNYFKNK